MPIDDPQDAVEGLIAAERRAQSPMLRYVPALAAIFGELPSQLIPELTPIASLAKVADFFIRRREDQNREILVETLAAELRRVKNRLEAAEGAHIRFMREEFPALLLDGLQKAEQSSNRERIKRLAKVLGHAAFSPSARATDDTQEMLRVVMGLSEPDIVVLDCIWDKQRGHLNAHGLVPRQIAVKKWPLELFKGHHLEYGAVYAACANLSSFGLIYLAEDRRPGGVSATPLTYGLLRKGDVFMRYLRGAVNLDGRI